jgi:hypothetical protein
MIKAYARGVDGPSVIKKIKPNYPSVEKRRWPYMAINFSRVCVDCNTPHGPYEGGLNEEGLLTLRYECPKCRKFTMKRVRFQDNDNVTPLTGFSWRGHIEKGGRPRTY